MYFKISYYCRYIVVNAIVLTLIKLEMSIFRLVSIFVGNDVKLFQTIDRR